MSDQLWQSFSTPNPLTPQGSGHDTLADAFATPHDDFAEHFGRHSHALDSHPTNYVPPLEPRTESDFSTLPKQPDRIDNPWEFMKQDFHNVWASHEHGVVGKLLGTLAIPGEAVAHSLAQATQTTEAAPHDTVGTWYNILSKTGPLPSGKEDAAYWSRLAGAWGATLLSDPLNYVGVGPTEHAVEAANTLKAATPAALDVAEGLTRAKPIAEVVHAPELNTQSIQDIAAPKLVGQHIQGLMDNLKDVDNPDVSQRLEALGRLQQHVSPGGASPEYLQHLENFRNGPGRADFTGSPWGVTSSKVPTMAKVGREVDPMRAITESDQWLNRTPEGFEGNLENLARRQVLKERQIQQGLPAFRLFGAKTPLPSLFPIIGQGISRLAGPYVQQTGLTQTAKQLAKEMGGDRGQAFLDGVKMVYPALSAEAHGGAENVPMHKLYDYVKGLQQGRAVGGALQSSLMPNQGVLTEAAPLGKWLENTVLNKTDITARRPMANALHAIYDGLASTAEKNPDLVMQNRGQNLRQAQSHIASMLEDPTFKAELDRYGPDPATFREQTLKAFHDNSNLLFGGGDTTGIIPGWTEALRVYTDASQRGDANALMRATQALHGMLNTALGPNGPLKDRVDAMFTAAHDLIHSHTPPDVQQSILKDALDAQKEGRQATTVLEAFHKMTDDVLQNHEHTNGLHFIGRLEEPTLNSALSQYGPTNPAVKDFLQQAAAAQGKTVPQMTAEVQKVFIDELQQMVGDGRLTSHEAQKAGEFVRALDADGLYHMTNYLKGFAGRLKETTSPIEELRRMRMGGFADWHDSLTEMDRHAFNKVRLPFEGAWNAMQWTHSPTALGKVWNNIMEPVMHATMRSMGWPQRLIEAMNAREGAHAMSKKQAEAGALGKWFGQDLPEVAKQFKPDISPQELNTVDQALVSVKDYEGGMLQPVDRTKQQVVKLKQALKSVPEGMDPKAWADHLNALTDAALPKKLPDGTWQDGDPTGLLAEAAKRGLRGSAERTDQAQRLLRIDQIARARVAQGKAQLAPIFGEKTDQALDAIVQHMNTLHTDPMAEAEVRSGQSTVHAKGYIPRKLTGTWDQKQAFYKDLQAIRKQGQVDLEEERLDPRLKGEASYEEARSYPSAAHHEFDIEQVNAYRKGLKPRQNGPKPPVQIGVDPSLTSRLAMRYHEHLRSQADIALMHELSDILPAHTLFFLPPRAGQALGRGTKRFADVGKAALAKDFRDVGDLVPSLKGFQVRKDLFKFLQSSIQPFEDPSQSEEVTKLLGMPIQAVQRWLKKANTSFSATHIRNTMANALVGGGLPIFKRAGELVSEAAQNYGKMGPHRWFSPVMPLARALQEHPLFEQGVRYGLFRSGHEYGMPLQDLIKMRMNPNSVKASLWSWLAHGAGPMNALTFDVTDTALRMSLFEKFQQMGMTPARAAEQTNHRMIDYAMRQFTPSARKVLQTSMPFPSWVLGNLMLHGEQAIRNPFWYALLNHATDAYNDHEGGVRNPKDASALAGAISMGHTAPNSNNKVWLNPNPPWKAPLRMEGQVVDELAGGHPLVAGKVAANYAASRLFPFPFDVQEMFRLHGGTQGEEKGTAQQMLFGKPGTSDTGLFGNTLWASQQYGLPAFLQVWTNPAEWHRPADLQKAYSRLRLPLPNADVRGLLEGQFGQTVQQTPEGKVVY